MTHLSMEQLVGLREPVLDAGLSAAREHLDRCSACQAELDGLHQRAARLRALPALRPARNQWNAIASRLAAEKRARQRRWSVVGVVALAASVTLAIVVHDLAKPQIADASEAIADAMNRSHTLERTLERYKPESRVVDGFTNRVAEQLEDRIGAVDQQLQAAQMLDLVEQQRVTLNLWRERVGLLDALVDVHVTKATNVGL